MHRFGYVIIGTLFSISTFPVQAEQVDVGGAPLYITRNDCRTLTRYQPSPDVAYQSGKDVHGKYVPPADLNGADYSGLVPDKVDFDILVNPLNYTKGNAGGQYNNTALKAAHVEVDLKTGETRVNGKRLDGPQEKIILDACRKAGIR